MKSCTHSYIIHFSNQPSNQGATKQGKQTNKTNNKSRDRHELVFAFFSLYVSMVSLSLSLSPLFLIPLFLPALFFCCSISYCLFVCLILLSPSFVSFISPFLRLHISKTCMRHGSLSPSSQKPSAHSLSFSLSIFSSSAIPVLPTPPSLTQTIIIYRR